ncbi:unnamed protein product [Paramecium primaurelia]|uniref:Uncharacterized protein n=1 Tax=Paramecium primaurelia TaxID=5886 RepID=A0A8S1MRT7_PARPR|nr:unnamed protein product [Paramecium primaurelia]
MNQNQQLCFVQKIPQANFQQFPNNYGYNQNNESQSTKKKQMSSSPSSDLFFSSITKNYFQYNCHQPKAHPKEVQNFNINTSCAVYQKQGSENIKRQDYINTFKQLKENFKNKQTLREKTQSEKLKLINTQSED